MNSLTCGFVLLQISGGMYHSGYLDEVAELPIDSQLGRNSSQESVISAVKSNPANARAWKTLLDRSESTRDHQKFLELLATVGKMIGQGKIARSSENVIGLNYARLMLRTKYENRSTSSFAGLTKQVQGLQIESSIIGEKLKETSFEPYSILLRSQRTPGYRQELRRMAQQKPASYFLRFQYTWSLLDSTVETTNAGTSVAPKTTEHFEELEKLLRDFPRQPTPVYFKMRILRIRRNPQAKIFAKKYLELESRDFFPFRVKEAREEAGK
jgi:hypothetical protein